MVKELICTCICTVIHTVHVYVVGRNYGDVLLCIMWLWWLSGHVKRTYKSYHDISESVCKDRDVAAFSKHDQAFSSDVKIIFSLVVLFSYTASGNYILDLKSIINDQLIYHVSIYFEDNW